MGSWAGVVRRVATASARLRAGVLRVRGTAGDLHAAWKVCLNVFDHMSARPPAARWWTRPTRRTPLRVPTTRKSMPGAKDLMTEAVMAGAFLHRLGLSRPALVFDHHLTFFGGFGRSQRSSCRISGPLR
ncbi:MAG: hypothetical protein ACLT98_14750 [Eggerthellaceae bacterium]